MSSTVTPLEKLPLESPAGTLLKYIINLQEQPRPNFKTAIEARDFISQYMPGRDHLFFDKDSEAIAKRFWGVLGDQMSKDAVTFDRLNWGQTASPQWETAKAFWSEGRQLFDNKFMQGLMKQNPEMVARSIKPGEVTKVRQIKDILTSYGSPAEKARGQDAWRGFQRAYAERKIIADPAQSEFKLSDLQKMRDRLNALGGPQLREIYGGDPAGQEFVRNARALSELMARTDFKAGLAAGKWEIMYDIIAATGGGIGGHLAPGVGAREGALTGLAVSQFGPATLSAILHSRGATGLLLKSMMSPHVTRGARIAAAQRILGLGVQELMRQPQPYDSLNIDQSAGDTH